MERACCALPGIKCFKTMPKMQNCTVEKMLLEFFYKSTNQKNGFMRNPKVFGVCYNVKGFEINGVCKKCQNAFLERSILDFCCEW